MFVSITTKRQRIKECDVLYRISLRSKLLSKTIILFHQTAGPIHTRLFCKTFRIVLKRVMNANKWSFEVLTLKSGVSPSRNYLFIIVRNECMLINVRALSSLLFKS